MTKAPLMPDTRKEPRRERRERQRRRQREERRARVAEIVRSPWFALAWFVPVAAAMLIVAALWSP